MKLTKENVQYTSAVCMLLSGSVMCYLNMYMPPIGEISAGALWYTGQCFLFAGAVYGFGTWAKTQMADIRGEMERMMKEIEKEKKEEKE